MEPEYSGRSATRRQALVYLDVGGQSFKIAKSTLASYPESLLSKMVAEFPSIVERGEELYVDRNPKAFPWIQEIYRGGDYANCVPDLPKEHLQKELDFYQLPSLWELQLEGCASRPPARDHVAEKLMNDILQEIDVCGLRDFFPWTILIYHRIVNGKLDPTQHIYISPPLPIVDAEYIARRGHTEFDKGLQMEGDLCPRQALGERTKLSPFNQNTAFLIWKKGYAFIELLQGQAQKHGMQLEEAKHATFYLSNGKMVYGHFILDYDCS